MPLASCTTLYGEAEIWPTAPPVERAQSVVYRPFSPTVFFDRDPDWGIYHPDGKLSRLAAYVRGPALRLVGQSDVLEIDPGAYPTVDEEHIYFGPLIPHYGHYLISSLARAWFLSQPGTEGIKLLCHGHGPFDEYNYMRVLTAALGLRGDRFVIPDVPTRFTNLTIPGAALVEEKGGWEAFTAPMHAIGDTLLGRRTIEENARPAYLSKSRLGPGSIASVVNEPEIEEILKGYGVDVVYPESLSLEQQTEIFASRRQVIGFTGSAFHNHILSRRPPEIIAVSLDDFVNANLIILDKLNNANAKYLYPDNNIAEVSVPGFTTGRRILHVRKFVRDILDAARIARNDVVTVPGQLAPDGVDDELSTDSGASMLYAYLCKNKDRPIHKMMHYVAAYERHFSRFVGQPVTFLEIGAGNGGSSQMWKHWFGPLARIVSIDINPICKQFEDDQVAIRLGDQSDSGFLQSLLDEFGPFDGVLDDGSHQMKHVMGSFDYLYPRISRSGVYMIEDVHTAYWPDYGGGLERQGTIIEYFKKAVDRINARNVPNGQLPPDQFTDTTCCLTAWDSVLVFEKAPVINRGNYIIGDQNQRFNY